MFFFPPNIFNLQLVESAGTDPPDAEGRMYCVSGPALEFFTSVIVVNAHNRLEEKGNISQFYKRGSRSVRFSPPL